MPRRAPAWCAPSSAGSGRPPATCCRCAGTTSAWVSEAWETRREKLFLLPGDLPVGSRLPLAALPRVEPADYPIVTQSDPMAEAPPLPDPEAASRNRAGRGRDRAHRARGRAARRPAQRVHAVTSARWRTISACSPRSRPPPPRLTLPVHLEGYAPPIDPRLDFIKVTPDPGVIEVNLHAARTAGARRSTSRSSSTRKRALTRLGTEKFMRDGRQTGTGGGSHIVVGGATPAESPFLRRPDLLKSIVLYWQRHPSLSYLFSGLFIGPTSQSPRVDEARHEALYELEIALAQVPKRGRGSAALAGRPPVPQSAGRRHRQYAPRRDLRRQAVLAGFADRPARPRRIPRLRDGAGRAHEPRAAIARARADRVVLRASRRRARACAGAPRCMTASCCRISSGRISPACSSDLERAGYRFDPAWFMAQREFRFPVPRRGRA